MVYNAARISLSERSRELASLRVLGFTRAEISAILLGELAIVTLLAVPVGLLLGRGIAAALIVAFDTEPLSNSASDFSSHLRRSHTVCGGVGVDLRTGGAS